MLQRTPRVIVPIALLARLAAAAPAVLHFAVDGPRVNNSITTAVSMDVLAAVTPTAVVYSYPPLVTGMTNVVAGICQKYGAKQLNTSDGPYIVECGLDRYGHDIASEEVRSFSECVNKCAQVEDCNVVSYMPGQNSEDEPAGCYLKKELPTATFNFGVISALKKKLVDYKVPETKGWIRIPEPEYAAAAAVAAADPEPVPEEVVLSSETSLLATLTANSSSITLIKAPTTSAYTTTSTKPIQSGFTWPTAGWNQTNTSSFNYLFPTCTVPLQPLTITTSGVSVATVTAIASNHTTTNSSVSSWWNNCTNATSTPQAGLCVPRPLINGTTTLQIAFESTPRSTPLLTQSTYQPTSQSTSKQALELPSEFPDFVLTDIDENIVIVEFNGEIFGQHTSFIATQTDLQPAATSPSKPYTISLPSSLTYSTYTQSLIVVTEPSGIVTQTIGALVPAATTTVAETETETEAVTKQHISTTNVLALTSPTTISISETRTQVVAPLQTETATRTETVPTTVPTTILKTSVQTSAQLVSESTQPSAQIVTESVSTESSFISPYPTLESTTESTTTTSSATPTRTLGSHRKFGGGGKKKGVAVAVKPSFLLAVVGGVFGVVL
ncbi:hypothetical protein CC78DRAFT_575754 [Lojkania enalia]|uniref:Apple domain-containing protein n=1 Tax=Lojkania enalia TaxID=147567 RepID=A0A9P4KHE9_9PLEO|nr:hypothetical protein CC78DRAFT_575754 [Didymosphaeria enalia]